MRYFNYDVLISHKWDKEIVNYVGLIHEHKGRQALYLKQKPEQLKKLIEIAKRQSTESSNEIEGIRTTKTRLIRLMNESTKPRNRAEEEILGYKNVLKIIHESYESIGITPNFILQLHKEMYKYMDVDFGGKLKNVPNVIMDGNKNIVFKPLEPYETPIALESLCLAYNHAVNDSNIDPLLVIPVFINDFLSIHPFRDGNGRMSRLLTTLLLYKNGYDIGKYISLEKKIQETKEEYYDALQSSSINWHDGKNDDTPFIKYLLGTFLAAYRDFEDRVDMVSTKKKAKDIVENAVIHLLGAFTKNDILEFCPDIERSSAENALRELCSEGLIERHGGGRSTYYIRVK